MKLLRKLTALITMLSLIIALAGISPNVNAFECNLSGVYINPLYEGLVEPQPLRSPSAVRSNSTRAAEYLRTIDDQAQFVRENMEARTTEFTLCFFDADLIDTTDKASAHLEEVLAEAFRHTGVPTEGDALKWVYGSVAYSLGAQQANGGYNYEMLLQFTYYTTADQENALTKEVNKLLDQLNVYNVNDYEKLKVIYDYICDNVSYDNANLENQEHVLKYTAYAALINKTAVCQGYALLFYRLALELGVDARLIAGDGGGPHGWNIAELNGLYYNLDATWDAGKTEYDYFLVCPNNFKDHIRYAEYDSSAFHQDYPMDSKDFDPSSLSCSHKYDAVVTAEAACTDSGMKTYTCSLCNDSYEEVIPALGHEEVVDEGFAATCMENGKTDGAHCGRCTEILTKQEEIPALGHLEVADIGYDPTCTVPGKTEGSHCTRCSTVLVAQEDIPATGHSWADATCTAPQTCQICSETEGTALGHDWDEGTVTKEPTETETGIRTYTCSRCPETREETIPALSHTHTYTAKVTDPTCTEAGYTIYTCECGDTFTSDETAALGHDWDEGTVTKEPTETETGIRTYTCSRCSETQTEEIPVLSHTHTYTAKVTDPTCTEVGCTTYTCTCGDTFTGNETAALGHDWDEGTVTQEPTETETGIRTYTCSRCPETREETIPVLSHTHNYTTKVINPTCTEAGYTTHTCECGDTFTDSETAALGHDWNKGTVTKEPTETESGTRTYTCSRCSQTRRENIPALIPVRLSGSDRVETSVSIANAMKDALCVEKFDAIIIAYGDNHADALAGSYLAAVKGAPILLHRASGKGDDVILTYIKENLAENGIVYLLGGTAALPKSIEDTLLAEHFNVKRLAGENRYDTNLAILSEAGIAAGEEILITASWEYADALSASATGKPVLLVNEIKNELTEAQIKFLKEHADHPFAIIGGTSAVSQTLEDFVNAIVATDVVRVYGETREETSVRFAKRYFDNPSFAVIAFSRAYPDGLCGGPLAYAYGAPMLLINEGKESAAADYVAENSITQGFILGGTAAVSDQSIQIIFDNN